MFSKIHLYHCILWKELLWKTQAVTLAIQMWNWSWHKELGDKEAMMDGVGFRRYGVPLFRKLWPWIAPCYQGHLESVSVLENDKSLKPGVVAHSCNFSIREAEAGVSWWDTSLGFVRRWCLQLLFITCSESSVRRRKSGLWRAGMCG